MAASAAVVAGSAVATSGAAGAGGRLAGAARGLGQRGAAGEGRPGHRNDDSASDDDRRRGQRNNREVEVWEWVDDLLEGFAEIYRVTVASGHTCGEHVRRAAYPVKETLVDTYDEVAKVINPSVEAQTAQGRFGGAPTFAHE
mmetsp:Transcript_80871/g.234491  ORF Transcript_80871/g.234491 Transcript_80871/m.234491 type:complete len:142 (+) Transcript_80871:115-540(+)